MVPYLDESLLFSLVGVCLLLRLLDFCLIASLVIGTPTLLPRLSATSSLILALFNVIFPGFEIFLLRFPSPDPSFGSLPSTLSTVDALSYTCLTNGLTTLICSLLTWDLLPSPVLLDPIDSFRFFTALASINSFVLVPFDELRLFSSSEIS